MVFLILAFDSNLEVVRTSSGTTLVPFLLVVSQNETDLLQTGIHAYACLSDGSAGAVGVFRAARYSSHTIRSTATAGTERNTPAMPPT